MVLSPAHRPHHGWSSSLSSPVGKAPEGAVGCRGPKAWFCVPCLGQEEQAWAMHSREYWLQRASCLLPVCAAHCCLPLPHSSCCTCSSPGTCKDGKCPSDGKCTSCRKNCSCFRRPCCSCSFCHSCCRVSSVSRKGIWYPGLCLRRGIRQARLLCLMWGRCLPHKHSNVYKTDFVFHTHTALPYLLCSFIESV